ncbi:MAG: class I SAM-dependent methyltransferase [Proteobacteria bacterium]|nr:class I SAM-dependent methyltransferase [Pseudomonadota bacterium]
MKENFKLLPGRLPLARLLDRGQRQLEALVDSFLPRDFLLEAMLKDSVCAEIGVHQGKFSRMILDIVRPKKLHLIDPWKYEEGEMYKHALYGGVFGGCQVDMDKRYENVVKRFRSEIENGQVVIHRGYSSEVCNDFEDNYFDWVYIDGNHLYEFVRKDLELYYRKVKDGGLITGDDYGYVGWRHVDVKKAVDDFVAKGFVKVIQIKNRQFILSKGVP